MKALPDTTTDRLSLHARGSDPDLTIFVPGHPEHWRQLWSVYWSFDEKPYPVGGFEIRANMPPPYDVVRFDITESGTQRINLGTDGPIFPKGLDLTFALTGNSNRKELAVTLR